MADEESGELSELDKNEKAVHVLGLRARNAVANDLEGADERLARALKLSSRMESARLIAEARALTSDPPIGEEWREGGDRSRSSSESAKGTRGSGRSRSGSASTTARRSSR